MAIQVVFSPPPGTTVPIAFADGSSLPPDASVVRNAPRCRQAELGGKQMANHAPSTTKTNIPSTTRKFLAAGCLALGLGSLGLFASGGTAAADGLEVTPMPRRSSTRMASRTTTRRLTRRTRLGRRPRLGDLTRRTRLGRGSRRIRAARGEG